MFSAEFAFLTVPREPAVPSRAYASRHLNIYFSLSLSLLSLLSVSHSQRFDELLQLASRGQHSNVDMLVKDIYGGAYESLGLTGDLIASSFGKSATTDKREPGFFNLRATKVNEKTVVV